MTISKIIIVTPINKSLHQHFVTSLSFSQNFVASVSVLNGISIYYHACFALQKRVGKSKNCCLICDATYSQSQYLYDHSSCRYFVLNFYHINFDQICIILF